MYNTLDMCFITGGGLTVYCDWCDRKLYKQTINCVGYESSIDIAISRHYKISSIEP